MNLPQYGKKNIAAGFLLMAGFMIYGFVLIYIRDFSPGKEEWIAQYATGKHFESRLAHVHGNLFAFLNIVVGYLLLRLPFRASTARAISGLALVGMLMPIGIVLEIVLSAPPIFVLLGAISMVIAVTWMGLSSWKLDVETQP